MPIKSPCILICSIDEATGYCHGCGRTRAEIGDWLTMSDTQRDEVMAALPARMEGKQRPPRRQTRRQALGARQSGPQDPQ